MSGLVQTTGPAAEPITLAEAKAWLRVLDTREDALIARLIRGARESVERFTNRSLVTQQWEYSIDVFPGTERFILNRIFESRTGFKSTREISLPRPPLVSVESLKYYDTDGALQTLSQSAYTVDTRTQPGRIALNENYDWPEAQARANAVIIAFTAGYGTPSQVSEDLLTAIFWILTHRFEDRNPVISGTTAAEIPSSAKSIMWDHRIPEFF